MKIFNRFLPCLLLVCCIACRSEKENEEQDFCETFRNVTLPASLKTVVGRDVVLSGKGIASGDRIRIKATAGGQVADWYYKSFGYDRDYQFRAYDLNTIHITSARYAPNATPENRARLTEFAEPYATANNRNEVLINVFAYDPSWTVEVREGGIVLPRHSCEGAGSPCTSSRLKPRC
jgi:hypothetical protein